MKVKKFDLSNYFVVGPENAEGKDLLGLIRDVLEAGFSFIQIRSKECSARELIKIVLDTSNLIESLGLQEKVTLVVDDRLDVVLAARDLGARVDGIHVGQKDIPVATCRKYLGEDSIIGQIGMYVVCRLIS